MRVHSYASLPHYQDHLAPILQALPEDAAGYYWAPSERKAWGLCIREHGGRASFHDDVWVVAGFADAVKMSHLGVQHLVYLEHGAGQTYPGDERSAGTGAYSGGYGLHHVGLFLSPSETVAARWRAAYPGAAVAVVGCPKLDRWHRESRIANPESRPVVAITFHHDQAQIPEQTSAFTHYRDAIPDLQDWVEREDVQLLGHGHPRVWRRMREFWRRHSIPCTDDLGEVFDRADLLIGDNTSALPEFASLDRPVVWMNAPWYRRDVEHGGRFWDWPRGQVMIDNPGELVEGVRLGLADDPRAREARREMVRGIYAQTDGQASARAAQAILEYAAAVA